jgi:hypothetical protein
MEVFMRKFTFGLLAIAALLTSTFSVATFAQAQTSAQAATCVDVSNYDNVKITWPNLGSAPNTVTVQTKQDLPACKDGTVWLSAYTLPQNYDNSGGFGFDYPTSFPQKAAGHTRIDVKAGQKLNNTYSVPAVDLCKSAGQYDVYMRPTPVTEILTGNGIREYSDVSWARGEVIKREMGDVCKPTTPVTPVTPTPTPPTPVELPKTGAEAPILIALLVGTLAYGAVYFVRRG